MFKNLFHHLYKEHDVILLEQEKQEIIHEMEQQPIYYIKVHCTKAYNNLEKKIQDEWMKVDGSLLSSDLAAFITAMEKVVTDANIANPRCRAEEAYSAHESDGELVFIGTNGCDRQLIVLHKIKAII